MGTGILTDLTNITYADRFIAYCSTLLHRKGVELTTTQRYVLITGATGRIGQSLVRTFADAGYEVVATDLSPTQPPGLPAVHYVTADLACFAVDPAYAEQTLAARGAPLKDGGLAGLINNASVQVLGSTAALTCTDWRQTLDVNLLAPFLLTQGLLSALAVDLGPRVRVNAIEPAAIATKMLEAGFAEHPEGLRELAGCHPSGRIGTPEEVARLALALVNGGLGFLHGACIGLDGAISARLFNPD